jgi:hypothetical protein
MYGRFFEVGFGREEIKKNVGSVMPTPMAKELREDLVGARHAVPPARWHLLNGHGMPCPYWPLAKYQSTERTRKDAASYGLG